MIGGYWEYNEINWYNYVRWVEIKIEGVKIMEGKELDTNMWNDILDINGNVQNDISDSDTIDNADSGDDVEAV